MQKLSLILLAFLFGFVSLSAETVITTGGKKGNYYKFGQRLATFIPGSKVVTSKGSVENINRLISGEAQVGITQADALRYMSKTNPKVDKKIEVVGPLQKECVYIVARKNGKVDDDGDLQDDGIKIAVGKDGSGTQVTWKYMTSLEDDFDEATPVYVGKRRAISQLLSGKIDAALFVYTPGNNWIVKVVNKNKDRLKFIPVTDGDLNDKYKGRPVYTFDSVPVARGGFFGPKKIKTICTEALVIAGDSIDNDNYDTLMDTMLMHRKEILHGLKRRR